MLRCRAQTAVEDGGIIYEEVDYTLAIAISISVVVCLILGFIAVKVYRSYATAKISDIVVDHDRDGDIDADDVLNAFDKVRRCVLVLLRTRVVRVVGGEWIRKVGANRLSLTLRCRQLLGLAALCVGFWCVLAN